MNAPHRSAGVPRPARRASSPLSHPLTRFHRLLLVCLALLHPNGLPRLCAAAPEQAAEAALFPFLDVFASPPAGSAQAFVIKGRVESLGALSFASAPPPFELAVEPPGRLRLQFPLGSTSFVACRNHQHLWAAPGADLQPYLDALPRATPSHSKTTLPDLRLPFSGKQLELFPALLQFVPKGTAPLENIPCEVVDIRLLPQLAKLLPPEAESWAMRLWISPQKRPIRIGLQHPLGSAVLRIDHVQFSTSLPPELWKPTADSVAVPASRFQGLLHHLGRTPNPTAPKSPSPPRAGN